MAEIELTKERLLALLNQYGSNRAVGRAIGVPESTIRYWIGKFELKHGPTVDNKILEVLRNSLGESKPIKPMEIEKVVGEALIIHLTDSHLGSVVADENGKTIYDKHIARVRFETLCSKILALLDNHISDGTKITEIHIFMTGDMVDGEGIYPGQPWRTDVAPPEQVIICADIIRNFLVSLRKMKLPIYVHAVKGNHGRVRKEFSPQSNWDLMLYMLLDQWLKWQKIKDIQIEYTTGDYLVTEVMGWKYLLRHYGPSQAETGSGSAKAGGWAAIHDFDAMVYGHYHHRALMDWNGKDLFMGPSLKGPDEFSESIAKDSEPAQCLWGVTRKHRTTFYYTVDLR